MERLSPKLFSWASICDDATRKQALRTSTMLFIWPHMALRSDCHLGKAATVGSVIPTRGAIMPAAVGVDIGCGMMAVKTEFRLEDLPADKTALHRAISSAIPLSAGKYNDHIWSSRTHKRIEQLERLGG